MTKEAARMERYAVLIQAAKDAFQSALDAHGTIGSMPPASAAWDVVSQFDGNTHPVFSEPMPRLFGSFYDELVRANAAGQISVYMDDPKAEVR